ncbi:hypothetical protein Hanom_Chr14g01270541 [Helianthus anomalus]
MVVQQEVIALEKALKEAMVPDDISRKIWADFGKEVRVSEWFFQRSSTFRLFC